MIQKRKNILILLSYLMLHYGPSSAVASLDQQNWDELSKRINTTQRSGNANLNVFSKILLANIRVRSQPGRTDDDVFLFQGDIKIDPNDVKNITDPGKKGREKRALMRDTTSLWKSPIYYQLSSALTKDAKHAIKGAIKEWQKVIPCMKWIEKTLSTKKKPDLYFIKGDGCYSMVGRSGKSQQKISIGSGCEDQGTAIHEIAHALGFWHEQSRPDRDTYVKIHWKNIIKKMRFNFDKYSTSKVNSHGKPYDYDSVMHYGSTDFAKRDGLQTMTSKTAGVTFGDKATLSKSDREQAKLLYKCKKGKGKKPSPQPKPATTAPADGSGSGYSGSFH